MKGGMCDHGRQVRLYRHHFPERRRDLVEKYPGHCLRRIANI
jgi:hypothetical protein